MLSKEELVKLTRKELQMLAKEYGVRANMKNVEIVEALLANAEAQELQNQETREQEAPTNTIKQEEEEVENGLTASADAVGQEQESNTIEMRGEPSYAGLEEREMQEAAASANTPAHIPTPDDSTAGQDAQSQSVGTGSAHPSNGPSSPEAQPRPRTRPLTPIPPKPQVPRVGPNFARFEQGKQADEQSKQADEQSKQTKESPDPRPVVRRTVQGAPIGIRKGEWSSLMNKVSAFEHTRMNIVDAVDGINVLVGRGERRMMRIEQGLGEHQSIRNQIEQFLAMSKRTTSNLGEGEEDEESGESPEQDERVQLGKRQRDDEEEDEADSDDVFGSPSCKRRRTGQ